MAKQTPLEKLATSSVRNFERKEPRPNAAFIETDCTIIDEDNKALDWNVVGAAREMPLEMTTTGASTVKVVLEDPHFEMLNHPIFANWMFKEIGAAKSSAKTFSRRSITDSTKAARYGEEEEREWILPIRNIDINVDGIFFRLAGFQVSETTLTLTFEDRLAAILRSMVGKVITHDRGKMTRAEFIVSLVREAEKRYRKHISVFCPEEKIVQEVGPDARSEEPKDIKAAAQHTLSASEATVKGQPASASQLKVLNEALEVCEELSAPSKAQVALLTALITESNAENTTSGGGTSKGVLQVETSQHPGVNVMNVKEVCTLFLKVGFTGTNGAIEIAKTNTKLAPYQIAQAVQGSGAGAASDGKANYGPYEAEADKMVRTAGTTSGNESLSGPVVAAVYAFTRGPFETSWDCIQRLASEVSWYAFVRNNQLWYVSGNFLLAQAPGMTVERGEDGVDWIEPHVEIGARDAVAETVIRGRASLWTVLPGGCVRIANAGPASGRWVVNSIELDVLDRSDAITVNLQKPLPARAEPNAGTEPAGSNGSSTAGAGDKTALAAFNASSTLSEMRLPYVWGGGHSSGALAKVKVGGQGLDCSGSTCWVLHEAGMFPAEAAQDSTELEKWGIPGQGKEMTVWASANHVFIEYNIPGHGRAQMNTNGVENGPRLYTLSQTPTYNPNPASEGYVARHWPGT